MTTKAQSKQKIQIPEINILPEEYRRPAISSLTWFLLLVVLGSAFAIYTLYPLWAQVRFELARTENQLKAEQQELKRLQAVEPQAKELKETIAKLEARKKDLLTSWEIFQKSRVNWRLILDAIQGSVPKGVTIDALSQKETTVTVHGLAPNPSSVNDYADALRSLGLTDDVGITYEMRPEGGVSFNLRLVVRTGGVP